MTKFFARFSQDKSGATAIEYGLIAALVAVVIIGGVTAAGTSLSDTFDCVAGSLSGGDVTTCPTTTPA